MLNQLLPYDLAARCPLVGLTLPVKTKKETAIKE